MAQLDDIVGAVMTYLQNNGLDNNTIVVFTTDNGTENFTWPDGGQTPFAGGKGTGLEGGFRVPTIVRWPGKVPAGKVENGIMSGLDWFPTLVAAAGNSNITSELLTGKQIGDRTFKVHLDGYNQLDLITGKGPSARHEIFYLTESTLAAVRIDDFKYRFTDQPGGWLGATQKVDWPILTNLRLDPFERTGMFNGKDNGSISYYNWFAYEFWRFMFAQQVVAKAAQSLTRQCSPVRVSICPPSKRRSTKRLPHAGSGTSKSHPARAPRTGGAESGAWSFARPPVCGRDTEAVRLWWCWRMSAFT
jgi:arylsulfatase